MVNGVKGRCGLAVAAVAGICLMAGPAWGHVAFDGLQPGAEFVAGSVAELSWVDTITHETTGYNLQFVPGGGAAAVPIATNLPPTQHSVSWQVPADPCSDCALYVLQDNVATDYSATLPITIVADESELMPDAGSMDGPPETPEGGCSVVAGSRSAPVQGPLAVVWLLATASLVLRRRHA